MGDEVSIPDGDEDISLHNRAQTISSDHPASYFTGTRFFLGRQSRQNIMTTPGMRGSGTSRIL
jgi:hypothetical protein